ncbi:cytochrome c maturation protein CcmE [Wolbachia endosymbiont of Pentidionis agamae]|uniref:cytochrome c maturation protein CcmE n=1 Tax=Wolbachia endosymbiont of Pentidionis agamae TaxID=3110435 RepID=UPI002FD6B46E
MKRKYKRLFVVLSAFCFLSCIIFFTLLKLKENISFFYTVSEAVSLDNNKLIRIGGTVIANSVVYSENGVLFEITDSIQSLAVKYKGILPPMFSEGSNIIAQGKAINSKLFLADTIYAKHDERYMPNKYK